MSDRDPATEIYEDVGTLYKLRNTIVHGSRQRSKLLRDQVQRVAVVKATNWAGLHLDVLVDRFRDLLRRAILVRLALSQGSEPVWPLRGVSEIDRVLADDTERIKLRQQWWQQLEAAGVKEE